MVFGPGETLIYNLAYGPLSGGKARILVGGDATEAGRTVWPIVVQARTSPGVSRLFEVQDQMVTLFDPEKSWTLGYDFQANEAGKRRYTRSRTNRKTGMATVLERTDSKPSRERSFNIGADCHDFASAVFWLRRQPLSVGNKPRLRVFTGAHTWELRGEVEGKERIETVNGEAEMLRVRFKSYKGGALVSGREVTLWLTDDPAHVPMRIHASYGLASIKAELEIYLPGVRD